MLCAPAMSAGKDKVVARWKEGVWPGVRLESGESLIGTSEGIVKARDSGEKVRERRRMECARLQRVRRCAMGAAHRSEKRI